MEWNIMGEKSKNVKRGVKEAGKKLEESRRKDAREIRTWVSITSNKIKSKQTSTSHILSGDLLNYGYNFFLWCAFLIDQVACWPCQ